MAGGFPDHRSNVDYSPPKRDKEDNLLYELSFTEKDLEGIDTPHNDALVLTVNICSYDVRRVLIDLGSSSEVMYLNAYNRLQKYIPKKDIRAVDAPIYSFSGDPVWPICIVYVGILCGQSV